MREIEIINTKAKIEFLKENHRGIISDLHIEHQTKHLNKLKNEKTKM